MRETIDDPARHVRLGVMLVWLVVAVAAAALLGSLGNRGYVDEGLALAFAAGTLHLALGACILGELRRAKSPASLAALMGRLPERFPWREVAMVVVAGGAWAAGANILVRLWLSRWTGSIDAAVAPFLKALKTTQHPFVVAAILFFVLVVLGPIVEEMVFRGIVLRRLAHRWGVRAAVVASSLLFGVLHGGSALGSAALGFLCAVLYLRTGTLWVPIAAHAANNLTPAVAGLGVILLGRGGQDEAATWSAGDLAWALPLALVGLALVVAVGLRLRPRDGWTLPRPTCRPPEPSSAPEQR